MQTTKPATLSEFAAHVERELTEYREAAADSMLTVQEAATLVGQTPRAINKRIAEGRLKAIKIGIGGRTSHHRIHVRDLLASYRSRGRGPKKNAQWLTHEQAKVALDAPDLLTHDEAVEHQRKQNQS